MNPARSSLSPTFRFRAGSQAVKVVAVTVFAAACAVGAAWWGADIARTWGLREADGGVLKPLWQRLALGGGLALLGAAFFAGMAVYWRFYIVGLDVEDEGRRVRIRRLFPLPELALPGQDVRLGDEVHTGNLQVGGVDLPTVIDVDAPWLSVYVRGWRWPLLLDLRGRIETSVPRGGRAPSPQDRSGRDGKPRPRNRG